MLSAEKRHCGIVFQNYALFPNLNVEENIAFGLEKKWDKAQRSQRVQQLLELIELPDIAKNIQTNCRVGSSNVLRLLVQLHKA